MTTIEITAMQAGPELDRAVQELVFKCPLAESVAPLPYSTDANAAHHLLAALPLFVARVDPPLDPQRPWSAGQMAHVPGGTFDHITMRVAAATLPLALCKAALIVALRPKAVRAKVAPKTKGKPAAKAPAKPSQPAPAPKGTRGKKTGKTPATAAAPEPSPRPIGQPRFYLGTHANLAPMPKRRAIALPEAQRP